MESRQESLKSLQIIPGVGKKIAQVLYDLDVKSPGDLKGKDPQEMYDRLCKQTGQRIDRCVLYVFCSAVYFASNEKHHPEKLKWWNWKDQYK